MSPNPQARLALVEDSDVETPPRLRMLSAAGLATALGLGTSLLVGRYRVDLDSGDWWWSDEIYTMHGWQRHEVEPGLDALRSRKHPDDRARVLRVAAEALRAGRTFACAHRIVDKNGRSHSVVVTGQGYRGGPGESPEVAGYVVDVTPFQQEVLSRRSTGIVNQAFVSRAVIEQAKGVIMAVRTVDEGSAERVLRDVARAVEVPLRSAADQMMTALRAEEGTPVTQAALTCALDAIQPVGRPRGHDPLLTRHRRSERG